MTRISCVVSRFLNVIFSDNKKSLFWFAHHRCLSFTCCHRDEQISDKFPTISSSAKFSTRLGKTSFALWMWMMWTPKEPYGPTKRRQICLSVGTVIYRATLDQLLVWKLSSESRPGCNRTHGTSSHETDEPRSGTIATNGPVN